MSSSEGCLTECGDDMVAEIHTAVQRDAMLAYTSGTLTDDNAFYIGKQSYLKSSLKSLQVKVVEVV